MALKIKYRFREPILQILEKAAEPLSLKNLAKALVGKHETDERHLHKLLDRELRHLVKEREIQRITGGLYRIRPPKHVIHEEQEKRREHKTRNRKGERTFKEKQRPQPPKVEPESGAAKPQRGLLIGKVSKNSRGFAFVALDNPPPGITEDLFLPPDQAEHLMTGDKVEVRIDKRSSPKGPSGQLVRIVERGMQKFVGRYTMGSSHVAAFAEVETKDHRFRVFLDRDPAFANTLDGSAVLVELTRAPEGRLSARGKIISVLADSMNGTIDDPFIITRHKLREFFPEDVLAEAAAVPSEVPAKDIEGRLDLRHLPFVTIDGADARDFDDAVFAENLPNNEIKLWVAIADVAHYVRPDSALDREAYTRATSIYFPHRVLPMLPERLSNGICSLNPDLDRLALVAEIHYDSAGLKKSYKVHEAVFKSYKRCVYEHLQEYYDDPKKHADEYPAKTLPSLATLMSLYKKLKIQRASRGSVELEIPEAKVIVDRKTGEVETIKKIDRVDTHKMIEEFMIAANEAVSEIMIKAKLPFLFRIHEIPEEEAVLKFLTVAKNLGATIDQRWLNDISPHMYQKLVEAVRPSPSVRVLNFMLLRSMKQAIYSAENMKHFGLASQAYTHFTSPIRRYPDLIVHRLLKAYIHKDRETALRAPGSEAKTIEEAALHCSKMERVAVDAERELIKMKQVRHAEKHLGETHDGLIVGVNAKGIFVELTDVFLEGFVPAERLGNDLQFNDQAMLLKERRSGRLFQLGDPIRVTIAKTNPQLLQIELEPVATPGQKKNTQPQAPQKKSKQEKNHIISPRPKGNKKGRR